MQASYDEIRRIHRLEKSQSKLVEVDLEFYSDLQEFMRSEKKDYLDSLRDLTATRARDYSNLKKMVEEIFSMREKKLMNKALAASRTEDVSEEHMATQEKKLFRDLLSLLRKHESLIAGVFSEAKGGVDPGKDLNTVSVEVLSDIPVFVGADMSEYGPFSKGQVVALPVKIAKLLGSKKLVEAKA